MIYTPRVLSTTLFRALKTFPAILVTGSRQSGKTTLLRHHLGGSHGYVSLDWPDSRAQVKADPEAFLRKHPAPVILDEIQYAPELFSYLKQRIDEDRRPGQWVLTGSQSFALMAGVSETLAGRIAILRLDPMSSAEAVGVPPQTLPSILETVFGGTSKVAGSADKRVPTIDLGDWLLRGGYPELRMTPDADRRLWFSSYVQTYLERDVRDILQVGDIETFSRFLFLVATRTGNLVNLADLARDIAVSPRTIGRWISVLRASQVIHLLQPWHRNLGKRVRRASKLYFLDTGLVTYLLGIHTEEAALQGISQGALVETLVVSEWIKAFRGQGLEPTIWFWQAAGGGEVDLIIEYNGRVYGLEVKATSSPTLRHADSLLKWRALVGRETPVALACNVPAPLNLGQDLRAVPWHLAW